GELIMLGAYTTFVVQQAIRAHAPELFDLSLAIALPLAFLVSGSVGVAIERVAYRPLREAPRISLLITAIGVSFLLENLIIVLPWAGGRQKPYPTPAFMTQIYTAGGVRIQGVTIWVPLIAAACLLGLIFLVYRTRVGRAMRAIATDIETTALMGADINRVISYTFLVGSALAAVGGILWGCRYPRLQWDLGIMPGWRAFTAAVIGGIGNIVGAMLGGFLLGLAEILIVAFLPGLSGFRDAFIFAILIFFLLFRPTGILGKPLKEKV
ncbi:MAG: branched-chain amino acid ABC transporter permease, partial [Candidatus Bipolaricaulaceae bacterium]